MKGEKWGSEHVVICAPERGEVEAKSWDGILSGAFEEWHRCLCGWNWGAGEGKVWRHEMRMDGKKDGKWKGRAGYVGSC